MIALRTLALGVVAIAATDVASLRDARFKSPMPGGTFAGYGGDTGLDVAGKYLPVYALASGTIDYSERGHTVWTRPPDTPLSVRVALDEPIAIDEPDEREPKKKRTRHITHVYYTHLSELRFAVAECTTPPCPERVHVGAGEPLGVSGIGNGSPHLHIGMLLDGDVSQTSWSFILREDRVRRVLGGYRNGQRLP